ncbi:hypothetical protein D3C76_1356840 [compost metagenome]
MLHHRFADIGIAQAVVHIITFSRQAIIPAHFDIEHQLLFDGLFPVVNTNCGDYRKLLYKYNIHHDLPGFWLNRIPLPANYAYYPQMQRIQIHFQNGTAL